MLRRLLQGYLAAVAGYFAGAIAATLLVRRLRPIPASSELAAIHNLRRVGDRMWAGGQPDPDGYRDLAALGVDTVVDLRSGTPDDPIEDDEEALARLGMTRLWFPVPDGHAPNPRVILRVLHDTQDRTAFVHCAAGIGRSGVVQAAAVWWQGGDFGVWDALAIGPVSLEQLWFVARGKIDHVPVIVQMLSRAIDAPRRWVSLLRRR
ncbi:MAG: tyrosine-protein phosphatase [Acidimicrobiia bacterium]|jgi:protein tyrosine phosphatase (PTP) superfamily phosphohydrolase (DUF442 family)